MRLLAIDTSSVSCSVALLLGDDVFERHEEQPRQHSRLLTPMIRDVLGEGACRLDELDAIALGNGPGSFIGMRIAASVAQGLAFGASLPIVPVSSLAAVAAEVFAETSARQVIVAQDAHMDEVYLGAYNRDASAAPRPVFDERLHGLMRIPEFLEDSQGRLAAGFGWQRYPELYALNEDLFEARSAVLYPRARFLLPSAVVALEAGATVDPADVVPAYLRHKVAEKPRERDT